MKNLVIKSAEAMTVLLSIFILGIFVPFLIVTFLVIFTGSHYDELIEGNVAFWIFTGIGWIVAGCYINEKIEE